MRISSKLLTLPATLLLLLLSSPTPSYARNEGQSLAQWKHVDPADSKHSPRGSLHQKREFEAVQSHIRAGHAPFVVKKMTEDESEMFFPEYWGFREQGDQFAILDSGTSDAASGWLSRKGSDEEVETGTLMNASTVLSMRPPFLVRAMQETTLSGRDIRTLISRHIKNDKNAAAAALALLEKRQFVCPTGTSPCSNMPSVCCATGENCVPITDNGLGSIGCCPQGFSCSGPIQCIPGNVPCNSTIGGGCCGPGDVCATIGCVPTSQITTTATTATTVLATSTQIPIPSTNLVVVTTVVTPSLPLSASTSTLTLTASPSSQKTTTITAATTVSSSPSTTGTTSPSAPARVSSSGTTAQPTVTPTTAISTATDSTCPTGYYVCSAYYPGGCCRVGRDCSEVDCPSTAYTTLISSGQTIVVPLTGAATTVASGTCATGWYSCAATDGGNCCPSGWSCGQVSCTSTGATATQTEDKEGVLLNGAVGLLSSLTRQLLGVYCLMGFLFLLIA